MPSATTRPKVHLPYHNAPITPNVKPVAVPSKSVMVNCRRRARRHSVTCTLPVAMPRTRIVADCSAVFPLMAEMIGVKLASKSTRDKVVS